jgi:hypothetical protein
MTDGKDAIEEMEKTLVMAACTGCTAWLLDRLRDVGERLLAVAKAQRAMVERIEKACVEECMCGVDDFGSHKGNCPACRVWARIHREDA